MKITIDWLKQKKACQDGVIWYKQNISNQKFDHAEIIAKLMDADKFYWASWLLTRLMNKEQNVRYAIYAAELAIDIYDSKYPADNRPRLAIDAAKEYLLNPCDVTKFAAYSAAYAAADAAADDAAYAAAYAAYAAYAAADDAAYSAADDAAYSAADDAAYSAAAKKEIQIKIINYGLELLK